MGALIMLSVILVGIYIFQIKSNLPDLHDSRVFNVANTSRIYADDGSTVLAELQIENREPVASLNEISPYVMKGTLSVEDARFYDHKGVDWLGVFRAAFVNLLGGNTQGGSTITMQLMRNTVLSNQAQQRSLERKISEVFLATELESMYSKDDILLMYLNTINYGDGCYGIKAASKHYFSKDPDKLDLNESATLSGIPQSPTYLNPNINYEACKERRNLVLGRMYDDHVITKEEYETNKAAEIPLKITNKDLASRFKYPYFTTYVRDQILEKYPKSEVFAGGFQIYTTLNVKHQEANEKGCAKNNARLEKDAESVAVTLDPSTGFITSIVGGKDYNTNQYNIATSSGRPTGSSFKAFTLVSAIEQGINPFQDMVNCSSPYTIGDITVHNIFNASYGTTTIQRATALSSNTGYVRLQQKVGTQSVIDTARKLGIKNADLPNITTLTLGSANINPVEMASAFATIANGGIYHEPTCIKSIVTADGKTILDNNPEAPENQGERVIDDRVAAAATKTLQTVFTSGTGESAQLSSGQPCAGKTGTSEDYRDHTLVGYTPNLVCATWIGKRNYAPTSSSVSCNYL